MALHSPLLWQGTPFQHAEGVLDFLAWHDRWHAILAGLASRPIRRLDDLSQQLAWHQTEHGKLAEALVIAAPSDFSLYDLTQRQGWVLFMQLHSLEHERLREAAGI